MSRDWDVKYYVLILSGTEASFKSASRPKKVTRPGVDGIPVRDLVVGAAKHTDVGVESF